MVTDNQYFTNLPFTPEPELATWFECAAVLKASIPTCPIWRAWWAIVSSWIVVQDNVECTRQCQLFHGHQSFLAVCSCSIPASTSTIMQCGFILLASLRHFHHSSSFCTISNFIAKDNIQRVGSTSRSSYSSELPLHCFIFSDSLFHVWKLISWADFAHDRLSRGCLKTMSPKRASCHY